MERFQKDIPEENDKELESVPISHSIVTGPGCSSATKDMFEDSPLASTSTVAAEQLVFAKEHIPSMVKVAIVSECNFHLRVEYSVVTTHWQVMFCKGHTS